MNGVEVVERERIQPDLHEALPRAGVVIDGPDERVMMHEHATNDRSGANPVFDSIRFHDGTREWDIPVVEVRGAGDGPALLVQGGLHAGELVGSEVSLRLIEAVAGRIAKGRLIVAPFACPPGTYHRGNTRGSVQSKNQVWPGEADGNEKERLYHALATELLPRASHVVDLHCYPYVKAPAAFAPNDEPASLELALAADVAVTKIQEPSQYDQPRRSPGENDALPKITTTMHCRTLGKPATLIEFPGHLLDARNAELGLRAVRRILVALGMMTATGPDESAPTTTTTTTTTTPMRIRETPCEAEDPQGAPPLAAARAPCKGLFIPADRDLRAGAWLEAGQRLGTIHEPQTLARTELRVPVTGRLNRYGWNHPVMDEDEGIAQMIRLDAPGDEVTVHRNQIAMAGPGLK